MAWCKFWDVAPKGKGSAEILEVFRHGLRILDACLAPVISQVLLPPFSRLFHAIGKGLAGPWSLLGLGKYLATPWELLGYTLGRAWEHRACALGKSLTYTCQLKSVVRHKSDNLNQRTLAVPLLISARFQSESASIQQ